ncbi:MAG: energy transducer TonB [Rhodocyclaceae bacterium]
MDKRFALAVLASLVFHGVVLSMQFKPPERNDARSRESGLEVVLVNARHARPPVDADVLAQASLEGGGASDENVRPTTPVPPQDATREGDALLDAQKRVEVAPTPQKPVMTSPQPERKQVARPDTQAPAEEAPPETKRPSGLDLMDSIAVAAQIEAQIDRSLNEYAKRPRRQFVGARTREYRFARYVDDWRLKVERVGTLNYPEAARGRLYGSLLLTVEIRSDGTLERVEVERSSGQKALDDAAIQIVKLSAPFAAFPPDIRVDTDNLVITRTLTFTNADRLRAE